MRKIIFQVMVSLDGYYEGPEHDISWHRVDEEFNDYAMGLLSSVDTLLFGRKTYEMMAAYWPTEAALGDDPVMADKMNSLAKIVVSTTMDNVKWNNTKLVKDNVAEEITALKQQPGKDIALFGSSCLAISLMKHGLIDEYRIIVAPVLLGSGRSLFCGIKEQVQLKLASMETFNSGNVLMCYKAI